MILFFDSGLFENVIFCTWLQILCMIRNDSGFPGSGVTVHPVRAIGANANKAVLLQQPTHLFWS
nr:MAG TPA: hypothetical protein [Caudoviricetes sp.]